MAIGDRDKNGRATDKVIHFVMDVAQGPKCNTKSWEAGSNRKSEVTCTKCMHLLNKEEYK